GRGHAALEQDRLAQIAHRLDERAVLHVARADLQEVGALRDERKRPVVLHLGDDLEAGSAARLLEQLQSFLPETLEVVWAGARLECSAPEQRRAALPHPSRGGEDLLLALHGAGTRHDHDLAATDGDPGDVDYRFLVIDLA